MSGHGDRRAWTSSGPTGSSNRSWRMARFGRSTRPPPRMAVQGVVVLVAVFLQQRDDLVSDDPEEPGGVLDGLARLQQE